MLGGLRANVESAVLLLAAFPYGIDRAFLAPEPPICAAAVVFALPCRNAEVSGVGEIVPCAGATQRGAVSARHFWEGVKTVRHVFLSFRG
jgi:hypothetical protein